MSDNYSNAIDMWSLGCLVHELLTGQIPFREIEYEADGLTEFDFGTGEVMELQTDMLAVTMFCDGKTEFPIDILKQSLVSETAIEFLKAILVAHPESRAAAKEALSSAWIVRGEELERNLSLDNLSINASKQDSEIAATGKNGVVGQSLPPPVTAEDSRPQPR